MRVGSTFDTVDKVGDFREERIIISIGVSLLVVISRSSDVEGRRLVRIYQSHVESIGPNLKLTSVSGTLKGDGVGERSNGTILVFPDGRGQSRDSELFGNLGLVDGDLGQFTGSFVVFNRSGTAVNKQFNAESCQTYTTELMSTSPPKYRDKSQK